MPSTELDPAADPATQLLLRRWVGPVERLGAQGAVALEGRRLIAAYRRTHRRYHDLTHLAAVLDHVDSLAAFAADADVVRVAAWFHDAVYDVHRDDNEAASAALAEVVLDRLDVDADCVAEVSRLVRLTATHDPAPEDRDGSVLTDADLAVLGGSAESYADYAAAVRAEYAHVEETTFRAVRADVLRRLLARPTLYRTPVGRAAWEVTARQNVIREIAFLES